MLGVPFTSILASASVAADDAGPVLETVRVSATALDEDPWNIASSFSIVDGRQLFQRTQATLGDTLAGLPGVHADTFGGGASRPVIRGQSGSRIKLLSDSSSLLDVSDISPDHATTIEPLLIKKAEILRGPATLLYGSGAIGGVVNVLDKKIPDARPENGLEGSMAVRGASAAREKAALVELTAQAGEHLVMHTEGAVRDAGDYRAPALGSPGGRIEGTYARAGNAGVGLSWVADSGYLGLAYSYRDEDYGLPGHSHEYEQCHPYGSVLHCGSHDEDGEDHDHDPEHEAVPRVALLNKRVDLRGEIHEPFAGVERIRLRANHTDYRHHEIEADEISATFLNEGYEVRIEVQHAALLGWRGVSGIQYSNTKSSVIGAEAFIPATKSGTLGLFVVEHYELDGAWHFEAGLRQEWQKYRPSNDSYGRPKFSDSATSLSAAAIWEVAPEYFLTLSTARSERLAHVQELYARGIHLASNTYECGLMPHTLTCGGVQNDAGLKVETSNNVELSLRKSTGDLTFSIGGYYNDVEDYIYARTLDRFEDFRLIKYTQQDARFMGLEVEASYRFGAGISATLFGDYVRAELAGGGDLPRIPAARHGSRIDLNAGRYRAELEYYRVEAQDDIADYETVTPGYDMLNLSVSYSPRDHTGYSVFLRGSNLLDEQIWNHSSFLANVVPLPGRSLSIGMRLAF
ncbi:TonB-dependent receptor [Steroidobacter denitrificans]|uniref:TonB-dependent receptor n=2 Tax=Steroidobacter denitrificans TaxID=465721 RepID=A0A127FAG1_STEDE|nr:TonB-dependent receptor [Steroidobacter denitrificans]